MTWLLVLALFIVTAQVLGLRAHLPSRCWTLIAAGFVITCLLVIAVIVQQWLPWWMTSLTVRRGVQLIAYACLIAGFHLFRRDLKAVGRWDGSNH